MANLLQLLTDLAVNPQKQIAYMANPEEVLRAAGLTQAEKVALMSGKPDKIGMAFASELTRPSFICLDPGPDPFPDPDPAPMPEPKPKPKPKPEPKPKSKPSMPPSPSKRIGRGFMR